MTRLRADFLLFITAVIWGTAFIAQKTGMEGLGPFGFIAARFSLSLLIILPLAIREARLKPVWPQGIGFRLFLFCAVFCGGVIAQQTALLSTSVTNAGFLTGLYVVFTPFAAWILFRHPPGRLIWPACAVAVAGIWLLSGPSLSVFHPGDWLALACAALFGGQVALIGFLVQKTGRPLAIVVIEYASCAALAWLCAFSFEEVTLAGFRDNAAQIAYAGIISGGIAYTIQAVAQQYTPPSDAAIIMAGEALFAALAGAWLLGERLDAGGWLGCALILCAIAMVELRALLKKSTH